MTLFTLWRVLDHTLNEQQRGNLSVRAVSAAEWFPGVRWVRSFLIDEPSRLLSLCLYEGPSVEAIRDHSALCAVPLAEIRPSIEFVAPGKGGPGPVAADGLFMVERRFHAGRPVAEIEQAIRSAGDTHGVTWLRSYVDVDGGMTRCILEAPSKGPVQAHAQANALPCTAVEAVSENHPSFWADVYDSFGLPRHWERPEAITSTER